MRIMLVDDEFLVRLGIKSLIDWERHGFTYAGDAQDGQEALALIGEVKPDIVLTDIVMPRMDGIELIGHVKRDYPHIHMIVLSSHTDYEYVRKAMKLGVEDYVLKASLKPEELVAILAEVAAKIRSGQGSPGMIPGTGPHAAGRFRPGEAGGPGLAGDGPGGLPRLDLAAVAAESRAALGEAAGALTGRTAESGTETAHGGGAGGAPARGGTPGAECGERSAADSGTGAANGRSGAGALVGGSPGWPAAARAASGGPLPAASAAPPQPDPLADRLRLLAVRPEPANGASAAQHDRLAHFVRLQFGGRVRTMFQPAGTGDIALLIPASGPDDGSAEASRQLGEELAAAARRFLNLSVAGGVSGAFSGRAGLAGAYREAAASLERSFYDARPGIYVYTSGGIQQEGAPALAPEDERQLRAAVRQMNAAGAKDLLHPLFDRIQEWAGPVEQFMPWCLRLLHTIQQTLEPHHAGMLEPLERELPLYKQVLGFRHVSEARDWFGQLIDYGCGHGKTVVPGSFRDEIRQLIGYVNVHYAEEISLRQAASLVAMSENYLSSLFKKETQVGFTDYVNGIRIEKAAELLAGTRLPVYQIAEKVGFGNFNYFGRLFKKIKGESPQQYRSKYLCGGVPRTV